MFQKFISYITFWRKPTPDEPSSIYLKMMHGINRIAILMFIVAVIVMLIRYVF